MAGGRWKIADESGRRFEGSEGQRWVIAKTEHALSQSIRADTEIFITARPFIFWARAQTYGL